MSSDCRGVAQFSNKKFKQLRPPFGPPSRHWKSSNRLGGPSQIAYWASGRSGSCGWDLIISEGAQDSGFTVWNCLWPRRTADGVLLNCATPLYPPTPCRRQPMDETAEKLDSMMDLTVRHLLRREAAGELHVYFATLMRAFDSALLHVHRSKFTQFLLFHVRRLLPLPLPLLACVIPALPPGGARFTASPQIPVSCFSSSKLNVGLETWLQRGRGSQPQITFMGVESTTD